MSDTTSKQRIILASASPRRREILSFMGIDFTVICADADESSNITDPATLTQELARRKGQAVYSLLAERGEADGAIIISADTVVAVNGEILGKPRDRADAERMLRKLSGNRHSVITGVAVTVNGKTYTDRSETFVFVDDITDEGIERYVNSGDPFDKAGAYGIQGSFSRWIRGIEGCYFGVVGLPVNCLARLLERATGLSVEQL